MPRKQKRQRRNPPKKRPQLRVGAGSSTRARITMTARDRAAGKWFAKLVALQSRLRGPDGCPWDREQTHASLRRFLIEEAYEALDAIESGNTPEFASELGDLLLQIVFHSILAEEGDRFTISDVIESVYTKMVRRHPHVFGTAEAKTAAAVLKNWEQIKREERAEEGKNTDTSILAGVPRSLPALLEADQLTRRAARAGFDWENLAGVLEKLEEEKRELQTLLPSTDRGHFRPATKNADLAQRIEEEIGDLFFAAVNVARFLGVDPEIALKSANRKFQLRFRWMEAMAGRQGLRFTDLPRERMEELWDESKKHN